MKLIGITIRQKPLKKNAGAVFVFGANKSHTLNRAAGGGGQAKVTKGKQNVAPIITMGEEKIWKNEWNYCVERILENFVKMGGTVVFPITGDGKSVNIGTGITKDGNPMASVGQKSAGITMQILQNTQLKEYNPKKAMEYYHRAIDKLQSFAANNREGIRGKMCQDKWGV